MSNQQEWNSAAMEHYKPAKPEGPAQQRCGMCNWPIVDNGTRIEHVDFDHPAEPAATEHGTGSGEAKWERQEACSECDGDGCLACTPPASPTVTIEDVIAKYREACDEVIRNAKPYIESASDWPETQHRMQAITAPLCAAERFHDDALALLRAAERQK